MLPLFYFQPIFEHTLPRQPWRRDLESLAHPRALRTDMHHQQQTLRGIARKSWQDLPIAGFFVHRDHRQ